MRHEPAYEAVRLGWAAAKRKLMMDLERESLSKAELAKENDGLRREALKKNEELQLLQARYIRLKEIVDQNGLATEMVSSGGQI